MSCRYTATIWMMILSLSSVAQHGYSSADENAERLFNKGFHYLTVDNVLADKFLTQSIAIDSLHGEAFYFRAIARFKQDSLESALRDLHTAGILDPDLKLVPIYKGFIYRKLEVPDSALFYFNKYLEVNPADTSAYNLVLRGKLRRLAGDLDGAIQDFESALNIDPVQESYHYYKYKALFENEEYRRAIDQIDEAIKLNPGFYGYYFSKGMAYYEIEKYKEAVGQYTIAINIHVDNAELYYHRGLAEHALNNIDAALLDYNTAIAYNEHEGLYYFQRGHAKMARGNKFEACNDWYMAGALGYYKDFDKIRQVCE